jgi:hypothetical protein
MRPIFQALVRLLLGAVVLPPIIVAILILSLVAICSEMRQQGWHWGRAEKWLFWRPARPALRRFGS